jgi:hypothetical protein
MNVVAAAGVATLTADHPGGEDATAATSPSLARRAIAAAPGEGGWRGGRGIHIGPAALAALALTLARDYGGPTTTSVPPSRAMRTAGCGGGVAHHHISSPGSTFSFADHK